MHTTNIDNIEYNDEQQRVADWISARTGSSIGAGNDPIGFVLASYDFLHSQIRHVQNQQLEISSQCEKFIQDHLSSPQLDQINIHLVIEFVQKIRQYLKIEQ